MAQLHLQLLGSRLIAQAESYDRSIDWIDGRIISHGKNLLRLINDLLAKDCYESVRVMVFEDLQFVREQIVFQKPVNCCTKILNDSNTLTVHLLNNKNHKDIADSDAMLLAVNFFLHIQAVLKILKRYNDSSDRVDKITAGYFREGHALVERILKKPSRKETSCANTFFQAVARKWKLVFDYTCGPCRKMGIPRCRLVEAIAWFKIRKHWNSTNSILHLESKLHTGSICGLPKDKLLTPEINNTSQLSPAALYLLNVTEFMLNNKCIISDQVEEDSKFDQVTEYIIENLSDRLGGIDIRFFGSRVMGIANYDSDYDVLIKSSSGRKSIECFDECIKWANENVEELQIIRMIPEGPLLLRVYVEPLEEVLDLTFGPPYVFANCQLKKYFFDLQPLARKLYFLLKTWKHEAEFSLNFQNHLLAMLIIFFMQQDNYLPSVRSLLIGRPMEMDTYNTNFRKDISQPPQPSDILTLTKDFFYYWAHFDWTQEGISVFEGAALPRETFRFQPDRYPAILCSDFFDQSRNCASNLGEAAYQKFIDACVDANDVLTKKKSM